MLQEMNLTSGGLPVREIGLDAINGAVMSVSARRTIGTIGMSARTVLHQGLFCGETSPIGNLRGLTLCDEP